MKISSAATPGKLLEHQTSSFIGVELGSRFFSNLDAEEPLVELSRFFQRRGIALTEAANSIVAKRAIS